MSNAQQTPLVELLDSVPQGAVFVATESNVPFPASTSHPVGRLCHEASERIKELEAQLETARMRLIACDVVALADTPDSAAKARAMHHDYRSHALEYVERRVDECIALRAQVEALRRALHEIAEEWAGSECGVPVYAQEAYAIGLAKRMYQLAVEAMKGQS